MFKRVRKYLAARRFKKKIATAMLVTTKTTPPVAATFVFDDTQSNTLTFTNNNGVKIFSIEPTGEAIWHKEDTYNEAADMFLQHLSMRIENSAGIIQNRMEWEKRITMAIAKEAKNAPIGPEDLTNVIRKCIMYDKLKGIKN